MFLFLLRKKIGIELVEDKIFISLVCAVEKLAISPDS